MTQCSYSSHFQRHIFGACNNLALDKCHKWPEVADKDISTVN